MILEKGIILAGTSRSNRDDYIEALSCLENSWFRENLGRIMGEQIEISNEKDLEVAFQNTKKLHLERPLLKFNL